MWYAISHHNGSYNWTDVYALNVGRDYTWAYPYTGFPPVEIDHRGVRCARHTPLDCARFRR